MKTLMLIMMVMLNMNAFALEIPKGFTQEKIDLGDVKINVYKGGKGEPLLLLHGYAQSALMWSKAMKHFQDKYTVIVPDIRGAGQSDAPESGYDKVTMANDMKKLLDHYKIKKTRLVGHDIGLMVAYTLAAKYPEMIEKLVVMDAFLPGVGPGEAIYNSPQIWHFRFNGAYPEKLVAGREMIYFDSLWVGFSARSDSFPKDAKKQYVKEYSRPGRMKAGFAYFKAFPQDAEVNKELSKTKLKMPVLALGGEKALGQGLVDTMKVAAENVKGVVVKDCGHWMLEECSVETLKELESFL